MAKPPGRGGCMTSLPTTEPRGRPTVYITHPRTGANVSFSELAKETSINKKTLMNRYERGDRGERLIRQTDPKLSKARSKVLAEKRQLEAMSSAMEDKFAERNRLRADWILATAPRLGDYGRLRERA